LSSTLRHNIIDAMERLAEASDKNFIMQAQKNNETLAK